MYFYIYTSPIIFQLLAVVLEGAVPAVVAADPLDDLLLLRGDEAATVAQLIVHLAVEDVDELPANHTFLRTGHVDVEQRQPALHGDPYLGTEQHAPLAADLPIAQVDGHR